MQKQIKVNNDLNTIVQATEKRSKALSMKQRMIKALTYKYLVSAYHKARAK